MRIILTLYIVLGMLCLTQFSILLVDIIQGRMAHLTQSPMYKANTDNLPLVLVIIMLAMSLLFIIVGGAILNNNHRKQKI